MIKIILTASLAVITVAFSAVASFATAPPEAATRAPQIVDTMDHSQRPRDADGALRYAQRPDQGSKGGQKGGGVEIHVGVREREVINSYFVEQHGRGNCPPGLAKKHNGCMPPGQAKKAYTVGRPLPSGVNLQDLPAELFRRLTPLPEGYRYGYINGDVLKISLRDRLVLDAVIYLPR